MISKTEVHEECPDFYPKQFGVEIHEWQMMYITAEKVSEQMPRLWIHQNKIRRLAVRPKSVTGCPTNGGKEKWQSIVN
jgi:hypothetical protein